MDQTDVALAAIIRSLRDVVAPAVDPSSALAQEQLNLAIEQLSFIRLRLDHLHARARFDLAHHLRVVREVDRVLAADGDEEQARRLKLAVQGAEEALSDPGSSMATLRARTADLAGPLSDVLADPDGTLSNDRCGDLVRAIASASAERATFERAWYAPLGLDPDTTDLPEFSDLLHGAP